MKGICPFCKKEVEFRHSIELEKFGCFHKIYEEKVWEYCPECKRVTSYAKYDMKRDRGIGTIGYRVYKSNKVYGGYSPRRRIQENQGD